MRFQCGRPRVLRALAMLGGLWTLGACNTGEQPEVATLAPPPSPELVAKGEEAFRRCKGCHASERNARSASGPNLAGVVGRVAGSQPGFPYTDAMAASEIVWDAQSLDKFLANPGGTIPGSDMRYGKVSDPQKREAIIAFLTFKSM